MKDVGEDLADGESSTKVPKILTKLAAINLIEFILSLTIVDFISFK